MTPTDLFELMIAKDWILQMLVSLINETETEMIWEDVTDIPMGIEKFLEVMLEQTWPDATSITLILRHSDLEIIETGFDYTVYDISSPFFDGYLVIEYPLP